MKHHVSHADREECAPQRWGRELISDFLCKVCRWEAGGEVGRRLGAEMKGAEAPFLWAKTPSL